MMEIYGAICAVVGFAVGVITEKLMASNYRRKQP